MLDFVLAIAHHLIVFALVATLAAELALAKPRVNAITVRRLSGLDRAYGILAGLILVVGALRVVFGDAGWSFYAGQWGFWAKMAAFALVGVLSIPPTIAFIRWRRAIDADPVSGLPGQDAVNAVRRWLWAEAGLLALIPIFAAVMRRGWGL